RALRVARIIRLQEGSSQRAERLFLLDRRRSGRHCLQQREGRRLRCAKGLEGHSRSPLEGQDQLQDLRIRSAVRTVVYATEDLRSQFLEGIRQAPAACV